MRNRGETDRAYMRRLEHEKTDAEVRALKAEGQANHYRALVTRLKTKMLTQLTELAQEIQVGGLG